MKGEAGATGAALTSAGATMTATAAVACCVPVLSSLLVTALGANGAVWVTGLRPYSPYLLVASLMLLGWAFWRVYGPGSGCRVEDGPERRRDGMARLTLGLLWLSTATWIAGVVAYFVLT